jgi:hypothetical protein
MNTTYIFSQEIRLDKRKRIVVETDQLPTGVVQITVFDAGMRPVAERLFYVNSDNRLLFNIIPETKVFKPGQETELTISVADGQGNPVEGIFSISVVDSITGIDAGVFTPTIEHTFNFYPNLQRNLPPEVLTYGIENLNDDDRDLLFMVYGWSRYTWDFSDQEIDPKETQNYDLLKIKILAGENKNKTTRNIDLLSLEGPSVLHLRANNDGEISLPFDSLPDITRTVTMIPDTKSKKNAVSASLTIPYNKEFFRSSPLLIPSQTIPAEKIQQTSVNNYFTPADSVIEIPEVAIVGHPGPKKIYQNIYEERYKYSDIKTSDPELIHRSIFLETAIRTLANPQLITADNIFIRSSTSFFGGGVPALIVLDGMPIYSQGWQMVKTISMSEISSVSVLKGNHAQTIYGLEAKGGVIFINTVFHDPTLTKVRTEWKSQNKNDKILLPVNLYRGYVEFYSPTKFDIDYDPRFQNLSTIYWNPEIYFNSNNPVKIKYTNLRHHGPVKIIINGISTGNLTGSGKASYIVK